MDVLRWKLTSRPAPWTAVANDIQPGVPPRVIGSSNCRITLVNHSTVLIQLAEQNILTDPIWSNRASPVSWFGPRRFARPGVRIEDLPRIDLVLLSHNHYDHLDVASLRRIWADHKPWFMVPLGVSEILARYGIPVEMEMDWWQTSGPVTCVPARHFSARGLRDRNRTLWCGYWIKTPGGPVYFAADTAFGSHFQEIRHRMGSPRIALLPIGAYKPEWFMEPVHMSPLQAVEGHRILQPERSVAIHWGTFQLGDDSGSEPVEDLEKALTANPGLSPFEVLPNGAAIELNGDYFRGNE